MLPSGLEAWIQKGKAQYKTFVLGGSGVGTIPIPTSKFIIITDFDYFPFIDNPGHASLHRIFQVSFSSQKSKNHYVIRSNNNLFHFQRDCYLVHEGDVNIDIVSVPPSLLWTTTYLPLPPISQEQPLPVGYGIAGEPAVRKIDFSPTESYLPLTKKRDDIAVTNYREQFRVDVNTDNKLNDVTIGNDYSFPLMNIGYVEFNMRANEFVMASN